MTAANCVGPIGTASEHERCTAAWEDLSTEYKLSSRNYKSQYAQMYYARLMELSPQLRKQAQERWPDTPALSRRPLEFNVVTLSSTELDGEMRGSETQALPAVKILCLEHGTEQVAIGTVYKDMKLKPTVLKEYTDDVTMAQQLDADQFCDDDDGLVLEDDTARIKLIGALDVGRMVTGMVMAVKGILDEKTGVFAVSELCYAGLPPQPVRGTLERTKYVALVSGLCIGEPALDVPKTMLLMDWVKGLFGDADQCKDVVRLVICGGTQGNMDALATAPASSKQQRFALEAVQEVDRCATELASALPVDIMPGPGDLSNHALPQQPLHQCLFPGAAPCENFFRATNPYRFSLDGVHLLGCSGQNLHDIIRYSQTDDPVQVMSDSMLQRHICCTAPDTLACFPFVDQDPFILRSSPHVYFVGNQASFAEGQVTDGDKTIKLISIPSFSKTGTVVLLDLKTLECRAVSFDVSL